MSIQGMDQPVGRGTTSNELDGTSPWSSHKEIVLFKCEHGSEAVLDAPVNTAYEIKLALPCGCNWISPNMVPLRKVVATHLPFTSFTRMAYEEF